MSPIGGKTDTKGDVYVLDRYIQGRPVKTRPTTNAERPDTDYFYDHGIYDKFPVRKAAYEDRRKSEKRDAERAREWARRALAAADAGESPPPTKRLALSDVLRLLYRAGPNGLTRQEICQHLGRDGGKVSGVMTDLHAAGIIFPLDGVRR